MEVHAFRHYISHAALMLGSVSIGPQAMIESPSALNSITTGPSVAGLTHFFVGFWSKKHLLKTKHLSKQAAPREFASCTYIYIHIHISDSPRKAEAALFRKG